MRKLIIGLFTLVSLVFLSACGADKLDGDYTGTMRFLGMESSVSMQFEGDKVYEIRDGEEFGDPGTYKIEEDELIMTLDEYTVRADLSDDKESFTVTSADGLLEMMSGIKFSKEAE